MDIIIDTSAILAVVANEPEKAALIRITRGATLVAPSSVHWEIGNAISAMFKRKFIELPEALGLVDAYSSIPIRLVDVPLRQAAELSKRLNIYAYDAYVIGCAINQRAPIVSLDGVMNERAKSLNLSTIEIGPE